MPDAPHVDVYKIGSRIVADTSSMQRKGCIPESCGRNPGHANVDGHGLHVETVASDTVSMSPEEFVAPRRAIATEDVDLKVRIPECGSQVVEQVEDARVVIVNYAGAVVAQITVEAKVGSLIESFAIAVDDVKVLSRIYLE
jgi:hypothetical protein